MVTNAHDLVANVHKELPQGLSHVGDNVVHGAQSVTNTLIKDGKGLWTHLGNGLHKLTAGFQAGGVHGLLHSGAAIAGGVGAFMLTGPGLLLGGIIAGVGMIAVGAMIHHKNKNSETHSGGGGMPPQSAPVQPRPQVSPGQSMSVSPGFTPAVTQSDQHSRA